MSEAAASMLFLLAIATTTAIHAADAVPAADPPIVGTWTSADGEARIAIAVTGDGSMAGSIVWMKQPNDEQGHPRVDVDNPDEHLRTHPVLGMRIISGLRGNAADGWTGGAIYDPESGSTYRCKANVETGGNRLDLRGYVGFSLLGRTEVWTRWLPPPAQAAPAPAPEHR